MLSLIELQNKKVEAKRKKYEKDEMDAYLELVFDNYKQLTEENAKLTEQLRNKERQMQAERDDLTSKIKTLSDGVQYYRSIETTLQKALILAEKTSKETKDAAILKAESIEKAAHLHADKIINNAEEEYQKIREKSMQLIQQFNQYKLQLKEAASAQLQLVEGSEFDIHKPEDLEPLLDIIKKERPDVVPWALEKRGNAVVERSPIADILDGCLAGILYEGTDDTVCNIYESDAYTKRVELAKRWQEKGYLAKDVITNIESGQSQVIAGDAFAAEFVIKPDEMQYEESLYGDKVIIIPFDNRPVLDTEDDWVTVWSIFSETKYPEEAVKVLGLLYSDEDVLNTILYGVEGMHYEVQEDGSFAFPSGINSSNVGYFCSTKWQFNTPKAGIWSGMSDDLEGDFKTFIASANISPAYGFWLDESKITVNIQKLKEIVSRYKKNLNIGLGADGKDVDTYLEEFRKELREAGSEELVKEVRDQYQAWKTKKEYINE